MSPAMVEVRSPSDKGQIFTPLFDQSPKSTNQQEQNPNPNPSKAMDQSQSFPSPFPFPPPSACGKPSLPKYRLKKVRRNITNRKLSASAQELLEKIEERSSRWSLFVPESGARDSESSDANANASPFGFGGMSFDGGTFVFGSGGLSLSRNSSGRSVGSFDSEKSEGNASVSGSVGSGMKKNDDLSRESSLGSDEGLVFSNLPDEMRKMNLKRSGSGNDLEEKIQAENGFVFGSTSVNTSSQNAEFGSGVKENGNFDSAVFVSGSGTKKNVDLGPDEGSFSKLPEEMNKLNLKNSSNVDDFGKKSVDLSRNLSVGPDEGSVKLPDEMRKMNLKDSGNMGDFEYKKQAEIASVFGGGGMNVLGSNSGRAQFVSGSQPINVGREKSTTHSFRFGGELNEISDAGVFVFRSGTKKNVGLGRDSSLKSVEGSFSKLPDEMSKLNLKNSSNVDDFEKNKKDENIFIFGGSKTGSGSSAGTNSNKFPESAEFVSFTGGISGSTLINIGSEKLKVVLGSFGSEGSGNSDVDMFVSGSRVKENVDFSRNSTLGSDEGLFPRLPEEMKKLNIDGMSGFEKAKRADNVFVFEGNKDATGSFASGVANKIGEESGKLNAATGVFVFVSSTEKSSASSFDNGNTFLEKDNEIGHQEKVDEGNSFIFGAGENVTASFGGSAVNTLHDNIEKLKINSNAENLAGNVPFTFAFEAEAKDQKSNMGSIPSSAAPGFQSPASFFPSTGKHVGLEIPHMEFRTPKQDVPQLTKETLFTETFKNTAFSAKKGNSRSTKPKKKKGKPKPSASVNHNAPIQFVAEDSGSPMDYSPYHEDVVADDYSREPSIASEGSFRFVLRDSSIGIQKSVSGDEQEEVLVSQAQRLNIGEDYGKRSSNDDSTFVDQQTYELGNDSDMSKKENMDLDNDARTTPMDAQAGFFSPNIERPVGDVRSEFTFSSSLEDRGESNFTFTASRFVEGPLPAAKHNSRRKNRLKSGQNSSVSTPNARTPLTSPIPNLIPHISVSGLPESIGQKITSSVPRNEAETKAGKSKETESRRESTSSGAATDIAAQEACEKWRFRGNQAYAKGHLTKAEDYYTRGVNSVTLKEIPNSCIRPLTLCFSNRAATRMSLGKMREALRDCKMAVSIDPNFLKARVRAANCHLSLGETGEALKHFKQCLQSEKDVSSDQKYLIEASDGLQKAKQVADLTGQSAELLLRRTSNDASKALNKISEALSTSPHSENLLEMKVEALLMMRNYDEVIKLCEQTLDSAEQNSVGTEADSEYMNSSPARLWRWRLIAKSYFYLGKLEESLELLQKHEKVNPAVDKSSESSTLFADTIRELLRLKSAGNEAFQAARHSEAVDFYSSALACNAESRPFTAVCFCNRAAAYQALGQIADAIADCSLAIALDPSYAKAISRRAALHELIRDYGQAANNLKMLISLLQKQMQEKDADSRGVGRSSNANDLKRARTRLGTVEEEARKGISLNLYMILGIEPSSSAADVKKAYRKAALKHHPDKAGQFLVRNEKVDDGLWREVASEVHADADRLFKIIGEAYTTLSDPTKRTQYDEEEDMRTCPVNGYDVSSPRSSSNAYYSSHYEKSFNMRQWRAASHASSYPRWYK